MNLLGTLYWLLPIAVFVAALPAFLFFAGLARMGERIRERMLPRVASFLARW